MTYSVSIPNLPQLQKQFKQAPLITANEVKRAVNKATVSLQSTAKTLAPVDTGRLRQGITRSNATVRGNVVEGAVRATAKYSLYVEQGTGVYNPNGGRPIQAKNGGYMTFKINGRWVRTRKVRGQRGQRFMERAIAAEQPRIDGYFQDAGERIARQLAA